MVANGESGDSCRCRTPGYFDRVIQGDGMQNLPRNDWQHIGCILPACSLAHTKSGKIRDSLMVG